VPSLETRKLWSEQRKGHKQEDAHIQARVNQLRGKVRSDEQRHNSVLGAIRRWRPELKAEILKAVEHIPKFERAPYQRCIYTDLAKKFNADVGLISKIHNNIDLYKEALNEWIKK
jgi:hypothetical protein